LSLLRRALMKANSAPEVAPVGSRPSPEQLNRRSGCAYQRARGASTPARYCDHVAACIHHKAANALRTSRSDPFNLEQPGRACKPAPATAPPTTTHSNSCRHSLEAYEGWGASHFAELWYVFDHLDQTQWRWSPADRKLAREISDYWVNFAKLGNPNGRGLPLWRAFTGGNAKVQYLVEPITAGGVPNIERRVCEASLLPHVSPPVSSGDRSQTRRILAPPSSVGN
jgi:hypothetical protein